MLLSITLLHNVDIKVKHRHKFQLTAWLGILQSSTLSTYQSNLKTWSSPHIIQYNKRTHTSLTALCPRLPGWACTREVKPIWILLKQETVTGSGVIWATCKSAPRSRQIITPAPHHSVFLQAGRSSCRPTNSVKALKTHYVIKMLEDTFILLHIYRILF